MSLKNKQIKANTGITLIALVITVIVIMILAAVSLNATIGDNGVVTKAVNASEQQKLARELENLNTELAALNITAISTKNQEEIANIAQTLIDNGTIDECIRKDGKITILPDPTTKTYTFFGIIGDNTYQIKLSNNVLNAEIATQVTGGEVQGGLALITKDNFDSESEESTEKGKFSITSDSEVIFADTISGNLSIYVRFRCACKS